MRLLVIGHTYLTAFAQQKYVEIRRQSDRLELKILTPRAIPHVFMQYSREIAPEFSAGEMVDIREFFGRSHMSYLLDPLRFARLLREFRPDRIHIEEDPYSVVGVETVFLARLFCPSAQISFFIWDNLARTPRFPLGLIKRILSRYSLSRAELVVCGNREGAQLLREKKGYRGRVAVLPQLGLEPAPYLAPQERAIRDELGVPENIPLIGFIGRLIPEKGLGLLLDALCRLMDIEWRVLVIGSGPLEEEIGGAWREKLGGRLIHCKAVPHADVPAYMRVMDVLVLPSYGTPRWKEQFGLVLAQAMLAGVPCVGSSSGAIPEVIGPGGLIFAEQNVDELAHAIKRLLVEPDLRRSLAKDAREFAMLNYTHTTVATAYLREFGWL